MWRAGSRFFYATGTGHALSNIFTSPTTILLLAACVGTILLWGRYRHIGRLIVSLVVLCGGLFAEFPVDQWVLKPLEERFPSPALPPHIDGIVVLGGAVESALWQDRGQPALNAGADRMTEFVILARRFPQAKLLFTGGPGHSRPNGAREADVARVLFEGLGIDGHRLTMEDRATTTWDNAVFSRELVQPKPGETWLLVTSANHIPRAMGSFRAVGWQMIAYPVGYKTYHNLDLRHSSGLGARLELLDIAAHEWIGLVVYWMQGRSSALFPGPEAAL
jgi:uncharacterized SAM-binding protein YcdF (DUF218 family)